MDEIIEHDHDPEYVKDVLAGLPDEARDLGLQYLSEFGIPALALLKARQFSRVIEESTRYRCKKIMARYQDHDPRIILYQIKAMREIRKLPSVLRAEAHQRIQAGEFPSHVLENIQAQEQFSTLLPEQQECVRAALERGCPLTLAIQVCTEGF